MVARILYVQGKPAESRARFEKILSIDPRAAVAANNLAYMDAEAGTNLDVALNRAQTAKAALPEDADVNDTLGWIYVKRGLPALAITPLEQAIQKDPKNPLYHYHLGMAYVGSGDRDRARPALQKALELSADFENAADARQALAALGR
jgi:tetratricopeptide (TPR) repeat protein